MTFRVFGAIINIRSKEYFVIQPSRKRHIEEGRHGMEIRTVLALASLMLAMYIGVTAHIGGMFFVQQMQKKHKKGYPLVAKGDWWGNIFLITPVMYITGRYLEAWTRNEINIALLIGAIIAIYLYCFVYRNGEDPDACAGAGEIHPAGFLTMVYSTPVFAFIGLFYIRTDATPEEVEAVGMLLGAYLFVANHVVLAWFRSMFSLSWAPDPFKKGSNSLLILLAGEIAVATATVMKM